MSQYQHLSQGGNQQQTAKTLIASPLSPITNLSRSRRSTANNRRSTDLRGPAQVKTSLFPVTATCHPSPMLRLILTGRANSRNKSANLAERYNLQVSCRVKANTSGGREGITAVANEKVDVCVASIPRNGKANAALSRVFAKVFNVAKSDVGVIHGLKSRNKLLCISNLDIGTESEEQFLRRAGQQLQDAVINK
ncbi:hypothetical protein BDW66DRAFT_147634 [Aspergillus desertorum]